jgi:hypothetical protein
MRGFFRKYIPKFFIQQWILGVARGNLVSMIRDREFNPQIEWMRVKGPEMLYADPFLYRNGSEYNILFEDYSMYDNYGKISVIKLGEHTGTNAHSVVLDTRSHLSYPFIYSENGTSYLFPEASQSGKLSCYEYDTATTTTRYIKDIVNLPLLDGTIYRYNNKYWLFGTINGPDADSKLHIFYADSLLGDYKAHPANPVRHGIDGSRPAGKIIEVDGQLYRPAQNSRYTYGGSITVNRIKKLTESEYEEEFHMTISLNGKNPSNRGMHGIHTINHIDDVIVVDGTVWRFSPALKWKQVKQKMKL